MYSSSTTVKSIYFAVWHEKKDFFKILSFFEGFSPNLSDNSERKGKNVANEIEYLSVKSKFQEIS